MLKIAEKDGLVVIDRETDAVTGTNRLLLAFPGLHDVLHYPHQPMGRGTSGRSQIVSAVTATPFEKKRRTHPSIDIQC